MENPLNLILQQRKQTEWCWAAVATSVSLFYDASTGQTQCNLVNQQLTQTSCCDDGSSSDCNKPSRLDWALSLTRNLTRYVQNPAELSEIRSEIDSGRPLGVRVGWDDSGDQGHFVVITGYDYSQVGQEKIDINDPNDPDGTPPSIWSYQSFKNGYQGLGRWTHTYFTHGG